MVGPFLVVGERFEQFQSKAGLKRVRRISLLDLSEHALINTVDWEPSEVDAAKLPEAGKIKNKQLVLGVTNVQAAFGGRYAITAELVQNGSPEKPAKANP